MLNDTHTGQLAVKGTKYTSDAMLHQPKQLFTKYELFYNYF